MIQFEPLLHGRKLTPSQQLHRQVWCEFGSVMWVVASVLTLIVSVFNMIRK